LQYDLIDLSKGVRARLKGTLRGIKETPTLLVENSPPRRYVGFKEISQYLRDLQSKPK
jgi:hypothetical protein